MDGEHGLVKKVVVSSVTYYCSFCNRRISKEDVECPWCGRRFDPTAFITRAISSKTNGYALTGFILGCASIFLCGIGIIPILAIVFSAIGLGSFNPQIHKHRWQAIAGLILGVIYTLVYLHLYGHI